MLAIAIDLEYYMGQYGIVWNSSVVEVASTTYADIIALSKHIFLSQLHRAKRDKIKFYCFTKSSSPTSVG